MAEPARHGLLELETRRRIFRAVQDSPGIHFRELQRRLALSIGTLEYNLHQLEGAGLLATRQAGGRKSYFAQQDLDRRDRDVMHHLRQDVSRRVAMLAVEQPGIRFQDLGRQLKLFPSRVSTVTQRLVRAGVLRQTQAGREKAFEAVEPERIKRLIIQYRATFVDAMVDRFAATWLDT